MANALVPIPETPAVSLTPKEELFINFYLGEARLNGAEAARRAGYSEGYARQIACELLAKPHVRAQVNAYLALAGVTRERLLNELATIAYAEWRDFVQIKFGQNDASGQPRIIDARMDLGAKVDAIELLGRELGMFNNKIDIGGEVIVKRLVGVDLARLRGEKTGADDDL
jgi:phage terminase small subunit